MRKHGGGVTDAYAFYPSTIHSAVNGSPPHACGAGRNLFPDNERQGATGHGSHNART